MNPHLTEEETRKDLSQRYSIVGTVRIRTQAGGPCPALSHHQLDLLDAGSSSGKNAKSLPCWLVPQREHPVLGSFPRLPCHLLHP